MRSRSCTRSPAASCAASGVKSTMSTKSTVTASYPSAMTAVPALESVGDGVRQDVAQERLGAGLFGEQVVLLGLEGAMAPGRDRRGHADARARSTPARGSDDYGDAEDVEDEEESDEGLRAAARRCAASRGSSRPERMTTSRRRPRRRSAECRRGSGRRARPAAPAKDQTMTALGVHEAAQRPLQQDRQERA